ncbi:MAG: translation initiation factor IF-2 [Eubacteriaceae bacterium]|nr:translation initiation factor IF-2 [Eubacteriaceae bacterium]
MTVDKKDQETKIVKAPPKKSEEGRDKEPKVQVKEAKVKPAAAKSKTVKPAPAAKAAAGEKGGRKIPGRPMPKNSGRPPIDKARAKKEVEAELAQEAEEAKKSVAAETAGNEPQVQETGSTDKAEPKKTEKKTTGEKKTAEEKPAEKKQHAGKQSEKKTAEKPKRHNGSRPVRRQEIKIIKTAEQQRAEAKEEKEKRAARAAKAEKAEKTEKRNKPAGKRVERKPASSGTQSSDSKPAASKRTPSKKRSDKDKDKDRFGRMEKKHSRREVKSLEKKARKKHVKQKPDPVPEVEAEPLPVGTKVVNVPITIAGFCEQVGVSVPSVIMTLLKLGVVANQNQNIDDATVEMIAEEMGIKVVIGQVEEEVEEEGLDLEEDREGDLKSRPPIITVMGHVDHGKTSLLDAIRKTNVTASESGGITQHIGASEVEINGQKIVFLDTPGHEAFTAMRARGADITDIAVLVVAADDSVKPQTIESISHAKAAGVPIIVAINKMDKPGANPDVVKKDLTEHGIVVEDWGGDVISVPVSAKTGDGIVNLLEMILLQAEVLELKANPDRLAMGTVLEARLDKAKGPVASLLVTNGTLKAGQSLVAGTCAGRIRLMTNHQGETIRKAGPATAVEVLGLTDVPAAGDTFNAVSEDRTAKEIAEKRKLKQREEVMARTSSSTLEELFSQIQEGEVKELNLVVKADVRGSVGAVISSLEKLSNENVKVKVVHSGVGAITESDVALAGTSDAIVIGFNVRPSSAVSSTAEREGVQIRTYRVIYNIIDDVENAMKGMLDPEFKEEVLGQCEVRETFKVPGAGIIAGGYVTDGKIVRNAEIRLVRDGIVIHEGVISSLKRFKDDAKEVAQGYECGIGIENYNDLKEGDVIECFHMVEVERK